MDGARACRVEWMSDLRLAGVTKEPSGVLDLGGMPVADV